jgi:hypothetical protein
MGALARFIRWTQRAREIDPFDPNKICIICHDPVNKAKETGETEVWCRLPCGHQFGNLCILKWLPAIEDPVCPVCRHPMTMLGCGHPVSPIRNLESKATKQVDYEKLEVKCDMMREGDCGYCATLKGRRNIIETNILRSLYTLGPSIHAGNDACGHGAVAAEALQSRLNEIERRRYKEWKQWWRHQKLKVQKPCQRNRADFFRETFSLERVQKIFKGTHIDDDDDE